jgi:hypothetical protein
VLQTRDTRIEEAAETCLDELVRDRDIALSSEDPVAPQAELAASIRHCLDDASARDLLLWWTKGTGRVRSAKLELWARRARAGGQVVGKPSDHLRWRRGGSSWTGLRFLNGVHARRSTR